MNVCSQILGMILFSLAMVSFSAMAMFTKVSIEKFKVTAYELTYW